MKRTYENELTINADGTISHDDCIDHCLLYAFGECGESHSLRCQGCQEHFELFEFMKSYVGADEFSQYAEIRDRLQYFLAHQARKVYLNAQFKAALNQLDEDGAVIIADYKMRVLPQSARETKEAFFGKRGWTLHTILVFIKKSGKNKLIVRAYDHWSTDTKQDAWFTASSFEAVFETIRKKPKWIRILSDNGPHYHNSQLMAIVSHWFEWYNIRVLGWQFLEPGEAKTTIDSHHASVSKYKARLCYFFTNTNFTQIAHAIKRYVRIGFDIAEGNDIIKAGQNLAGTSFANIEPDRGQMGEENAGKKAPVKTIPGISKYYYWEWPTEGPLAGYICARPLPHVGSWENYSPAAVANLCNTEIVRPKPSFSEHTENLIDWEMQMPRMSGRSNYEGSL